MIVSVEVLADMVVCMEPPFGGEVGFFPGGSVPDGGLVTEGFVLYVVSILDFGSVVVFGVVVTGESV